MDPLINSLIFMSSTDLPEKTQVKPIYKNRNSMITGVFQDVTRHTEYWNWWIVDKGWVDAIKSRFNIPVAFAFDTKHLNSAIARSPVYNSIDDIAIPNHRMFCLLISCRIRWYEMYFAPDFNDTIHCRVLGTIYLMKL